ncbi:hypothetical protein [Amycolatopsis sp. NPDC058986]|uniref:hypothetical protein n=1 Tax=unclassified Amycolatopsis TaxID=2618356 RepID=UPI00366C1BAA
MSTDHIAVDLSGTPAPIAVRPGTWVQILLPATGTTVMTRVNPDGRYRCCEDVARGIAFVRPIVEGQDAALVAPMTSPLPRRVGERV